MAYGMQTRIEQPHTIAVELVRTALEKALLSRRQGRAAARSHDLYYLYEANRRLSF